MDRGAWWATVHGVTKSWTGLSDQDHTHIWILCAQSCPTLCDPMDCSLPGPSVHGILQARILEWVATPSSRDLPNPGIEPRSPTLQVDSTPSEPPWQAKNIGVGSLFLLQRIFLTQELNPGLLHCRWILYQLRYQGSPILTLLLVNFYLSKHNWL